MMLKETRLNAGLTVSALAREAKVDRRVVDKAEEGEAITAVSARKIVRALNQITGRNDTERTLHIEIK